MSGESPSATSFAGLRLETGWDWSVRVGRQLLRFLFLLQGLGAFALIALGVVVRKFGSSPSVVLPLIRKELVRCGWRLLPMSLLLSVVLGLVIIGQTVSLLTRVGAQNYLGLVMVTAVVRELGPLLTVLLVLSRVGTATVVELGTARALGEVEALEVMGIDPIHYLVVPRLIGMVLGVFALTVYLILGALLSGYLWAFLQDVPITPASYFEQMTASLTWFDFVLLTLKAAAFGAIIATVTCYHGLARPLSLADVSPATVRAVAQCIILCVLADALFLIVFLIAR